MTDTGKPSTAAPFLRLAPSPGWCLVFWILVLLLSGCQSGKPPAASASQVSVQSEPRVSARQSAEERRAQVLAEWLEQAEQALFEDRLLTPAEDNAYERYQAVLYLDPDNERARTGLQAIVLRYLDLARSAARRGALAPAREMLDRAELVDPGNPLVDELEAELQQARKHRSQNEPLAEMGDSYLLDSQRLSEKAPELVQELHNLAARLPETGDFVLIVAPTDAEGRWIYRQLREAVPDYRVRGNIQLGSPPRIRLLPTD